MALNKANARDEFTVGQLRALIVGVPDDTPVMVNYCDATTLCPAAAMHTRIVCGANLNFEDHPYYHVADPHKFGTMAAQDVVAIFVAHDADSRPLAVVQA